MGIADEFEGASLGDKRLARRLLRVAEQLEAEPTASVAAAMASTAEREAAYRLLGNERVTLEQVLMPHLTATARRAAEAQTIIVPHDTTEVGFSTPRNGLGRINDAQMGRGFFLHTALAVRADGSRDPLGVLGVRQHLRMEGPRKRKRKHTERVPEAEKESARWWQLVADVSQRLSAETQAIHVMDREADDYVLLTRLIQAGHRFVIRAQYNRQIEVNRYKDATLTKALTGLSGRVTRQITLGSRKPKPLAKSILPPSRLRTATLEFRATTVTLCRPNPTPVTEIDVPKTLTVNLVHVVEPNPPEGYEPIEWKLLTMEPIATSEDIEAIVDAYDTRWVIEEYFKALKTGCAFEKRELENAHSIFNLLAIFLPIAWKLLRLRTLARAETDTPATTVLTKLQIAILRKHDVARLTAAAPTIRDAYLAIARLGAHIKNNGPPGWQVLARGFLQLQTLAEGAAIALGLPANDYL